MSISYNFNRIYKTADTRVKYDYKLIYFRTFRGTDDILKHLYRVIIPLHG